MSRATVAVAITVYHGTSGAALEPIRSTGPQKYRRNYTARPCFCTTRSRRVAQLFATRKTGVDDWLAGRLTGVVLEFELAGTEGRDYAPARDPSCLQDEQEVAVFNVSRLTLAAVWRHDGADWKRETV